MCYTCESFPSLQSEKNCSGSDIQPPGDLNDHDSDTEIFWVKRRSLRVKKNILNDNRIKKPSQQVLWM